MRKAIIACIALAFLTSPLHAESAGSAALKGGAKGAGEGGGGQGGSGKPDPMSQIFQQTLQQQQARPNSQSSSKGAGGTGLGSSQNKGRQ